MHNIQVVYMSKFNTFGQTVKTLVVCVSFVDRVVCLLVGCLTSQQHASVSQGRICSDNFTCCHTEIKVADQTFYLTQSQYTDTRPTSPSTDPITPGAWQGSHWSANFQVTGMTRPRKNPGAWFQPGSSVLEVDTLTTWPTRWFDRVVNTLVEHVTVYSNSQYSDPYTCGMRHSLTQQLVGWSVQFWSMSSEHNSQ